MGRCSHSRSWAKFTGLVTALVLCPVLIGLGLIGLMQDQQNQMATAWKAACSRDGQIYQNVVAHTRKWNDFVDALAGKKYAGTFPADGELAFYLRRLLIGRKSWSISELTYPFAELAEERRKLASEQDAGKFETLKRQTLSAEVSGRMLDENGLDLQMFEKVRVCLEEVSVSQLAEELPELPLVAPFQFRNVWAEKLNRDHWGWFLLVWLALSTFAIVFARVHRVVNRWHTESGAPCSIEFTCCCRNGWPAGQPLQSNSPAVRCGLQVAADLCPRNDAGAATPRLSGVDLAQFRLAVVHQRRPTVGLIFPASVSPPSRLCAVGAVVVLKINLVFFRPNESETHLVFFENILREGFDLG